MIYLDNAATTRQKPQPVVDAVVSAMTTLGNSARGTHEGSLSASRMIYGTREKLATFFNCPRPDHVVFTANSTMALNMAICGLLDPGDHVIATDLEHNSVLRPLYRLEAERSVSLSFVPADRQGRIDYGEFGRLIRPETRAIICTHASNLTGNAVDIGRVGAIAHVHGLIFLVDASQTAGVLPIDMEAQQIDLLCFTGHKSLMGPQGTGGLCLGENVALRPWKVGGTGVQTYNPAQPEQLPTRLEAGTLNGHGIAGLSAALDYLEETPRPDPEKLIAACCRVKARCIAADERDDGPRRLLNFGHTFGHVYEAAGGYAAYTHGEAVAAGMTQMLRWQIAHGFGGDFLLARLERLLARFGLPTAIDCDGDTLRRYLTHDKKAAGSRITVVVTERPGEGRLEELPLESLWEDMP